MSSFSKTK